MNHSEAVEQLAVERYLLDELAPDNREAFEEHLFDCQECALDLRAGTFFVNEAKTQLPSMPDKADADRRDRQMKPGFWLLLFRPALVAPAFAALLGIVVFQNAVTFPALRTAANQPSLAPLTHLRPATRGAAHQTLIADPAHGIALQVDRPLESDVLAPTSYSIELRDAQGKSLWTASTPVNTDTSEQSAQLSVFIPGMRLGNGTYTLDVRGLGAHGERSSEEQYVFDIVVSN